VSLSWSSASSAAEQRPARTTGGAVGGSSPAVSPASSARSSLSAADADDEAPRPPLTPYQHGIGVDTSEAAAAGASAPQGAAGSARVRALPLQPALLSRARTGPPDFLVGVWPPSEAAGQRSADGGAPARPAAKRSGEKNIRRSAWETGTAAAAGPVASGRSKLWQSLADVLGLVPDPPSGFIQSSHWAADDVGHVQRSSADGLAAAAAANLRRTQSVGCADVIVRGATGGNLSSPADAAAAAVSPPCGATIATSASGPDAKTGPSSHQRSSSLAQTLQRAASAASSLWRGGDSRGGSSGDSSPREPAASPRAQCDVTAAVSEARSISAEATITAKETTIAAATHSKCQCPQHRAKAAAAAAAAAKAAMTARAEADPASRAAQVAGERAAADGQPVTRKQQPQEHLLPLSFPVPWLAQQPECAAATGRKDATVLSIAKASR